MQKSLGLLLCGLYLGCADTAPGNNNPGQMMMNPTEETPAVLSTVTPVSYYGSRTVTLQIAGVGTNFAATSQVDFGDPELVVTKVEAGSTSSLRVTVDISPLAKIGAHDLTVKSTLAGGKTETAKLSGGFTVLASLVLETPQTLPLVTQVEQGGMVTVRAKNLDYRDNPFTPGQSYETYLSSGAVETDGALNSTSATVHESLGLVDALASTTSGLSVGVTTRNAIGNVVRYVSDPADMNAPRPVGRTPVSLIQATPQNGLAFPGDRTTGFFKVTTQADNQVAWLNFTGLGASLTGFFAPRIVGHVAPASGRFSEGVPFDSSTGTGMRSALVYLPKAGNSYFVVHPDDVRGGTMYTYSLTAKMTAASSLSGKEPAIPDTPMMPIADLPMLDKPYYVLDGRIDRVNDIDYYKFKAAKTGRIYAQVHSPEVQELEMGLTDSACGTATAQLTVTALAAELAATAGTTYCITVSGGQPMNYTLIFSQDF